MSADLALRPMSTSQVLDRTFSLYRRNFLLFAGIAALPPALVLAGQLMLLLLTRIFPAGPRASAGPAAVVAVVVAVLGGIAIFMLWLVGYALASGASVYAVSQVHLGHPTTIGECYRLIRPHTGRILGIVIILFLFGFVVIALGVACLAVPIIIMISSRGSLSEGATTATAAGIFVGGVLCLAAVLFTIFLSAKFSLTVPACVLEKRGVFDSLKRSWWLTTGSVWRLILVNFLAAVLAGVLAGVLAIPYLIGVALVISKKDPSLLVPFIIWQYFGNFLAKTLAGPIATIAAALIYYDQRVRKEAFDLQLMMEAIGQPALPQAAGAASPGLG